MSRKAVTAFSHLPELVCRIWHPDRRSLHHCAPLLGCRGFVGPVPPPLWIRVAYLIVAETITGAF